MQNRIILYLTIPLTVFILIVSCTSLISTDFYAAETKNWQAQSIGQDLIDLFLIAPCLLISAIIAYRNNRNATVIWGGVVLYLTYTFTLYCFDVHFNKLFVLYCLCLALSFYSLVYFLFTQYKSHKPPLENKKMTRFIGIYFIIIAILFYCLWLSEIIPSTIQNKVPKSIADAGLLTNGVHVLDLAILLPAVFMTGVFLIKRISLAYMLTPVILTFFILMDITIGVLAVVMEINGIESNLMITWMMAILAFISLVLLYSYLKNTTGIL